LLITFRESKKIGENYTREILIFKNSGSLAVVYFFTAWLFFYFSV